MKRLQHPLPREPAYIYKSFLVWTPQLIDQCGVCLGSAYNSIQQSSAIPQKWNLAHFQNGINYDHSNRRTLFLYIGGPFYVMYFRWNVRSVRFETALVDNLFHAYLLQPIFLYISKSMLHHFYKCAYKYALIQFLNDKLRVYMTKLKILPFDIIMKFRIMKTLIIQIRIV